MGYGLVELLLEVSIDQLRHDWVDSGKMDASTFESICRSTNNKSAYATWMVKKVSDRTIPYHASTETEDQWKEIFTVFEKNKQKFEIKDLNQYKTFDQIRSLIQKVREIQEDIKKKAEQKDIDRFKIGGVELENGKGYLVYKLPQGHPENRQISVKLGRTSGNNRGWCTAYDSEYVRYWDDHIAREDLYIFINPNDRINDKFQIQFGYFGARPFPISTDEPVPENELTPFLPFYQFLREKEGRPIPMALRKVVAFREALNTNAPLNSLKVQDNVYKVSASTELEEWINPICRQLLGISDESAMRLSSWVSNRQETAEDVVFLSSGDLVVSFAISSRRVVDNLIDISGSRARLISTNSFYGLDVNEQSKDLYKKYIEVIQSYGQRASVQLVLKYGSEDLESADHFKKGTKGKVTYYIIPESESPLRMIKEVCNFPAGSADRKVENVYRQLNGAVGVLVQGTDVVFLSRITSEVDDISLVRVKSGDVEYRQINYNPDVIYEMYKALKSFNDSVVFPRKIQLIDNIKTGQIDSYSVPTIGSASKLFKIPGDQVDSVIPYRIPRHSRISERYSILGFISKWQFVLSDSGHFELTGRWGSSGSSSWIESVKGLGETLIGICEEYRIPYPDGLLQWIPKHPGVVDSIRRQRQQQSQGDSNNTEEQPQQQAVSQPENRPEPQQQQGSRGTEQPSTGEDASARSLTIQRRLQSAEREGLLRSTEIHVADYITSRGSRRNLTLNVACLQGPWEEFEHSLLRSRTGLVGQAIDWARENNCRITYCYLWPVESTWNGLLVVKNSEGNTVRVYRRLGYGMNAGYRAYRNSDEWTLRL